MIKPRLVIAGVQSGVGKTTFTVGLCCALRQLGLRVSVFKCGPDYLDPTWHSLAAGVPSHTLDGWMMHRDALLTTFARASQDSDIALIEGVMGLFDSADATSEAGSTAEIAKWLGAPVLLVVDASGIARSIAALASGFASFDANLPIGGLICNRVGSRSHLTLLREACAEPPVLGGLPKNLALSFPSRHLGLRSAAEAELPPDCLQSWAASVSEWCDVDEILALARNAPDLSIPSNKSPDAFPDGATAKARIAIAWDEAFSFYYDENLRLLELAGAELVRFSPLHDWTLPAADALYLGGGYPEAHASQLSANSDMRAAIYRFCAAGKPVYAECGGLMYLCSEIVQLDGSRNPMIGWFDASSVMCDRLQALGYVEATTTRDTVLGPAGQTFRGHQFRYSNLHWNQPAATSYTVTKRRDGSQHAEGFICSKVLGSYIHGHWASSGSIPKNLVAACLC